MLVWAPAQGPGFRLVATAASSPSAVTGEVTVTANCSAVDFSTPGAYEVACEATDVTGNSVGSGTFSFQLG